MARIPLLFVVGSLLLLISCPGDSYRCYECDSITYTGCADPMKQDYVNLLDCDETTHYTERPIGCKKVISKTTEGMKIERGCISIEEMREFSEDSPDCIEPHYSTSVLCRCMSDKCNGAQFRSGGSIFIIALTASLLFITGFST